MVAHRHENKARKERKTAKSKPFKAGPELTITQISMALTNALNEGIDELAREVGIVKRQSKISGRSLVQGLVQGWMQNPQASETQIAQSVGQAGRAVTPQAVNARFTEATAEFLFKVLEQVTKIVVQPDKEAQTLLNRFSAVNVNDSTVVMLPDALRSIWAGCGSRTGHGKAGAKIQVQWELRSGQLKELTLHAAREQDRSAPVQRAEVIPNSLRLADLGYFSLRVFERIAAAGGFWMSRYLSGVSLYSTQGKQFDLAHWLKRHCTSNTNTDIQVVVGQASSLPARLVAVRVPLQVAAERRRKLRERARSKGQAVSEQSLTLADWNIFLTNVPAQTLNVEEVLIIARTRWQIELLFKIWKSAGKIDESRSKKPFRRLCEFYAKLIGQIIQHWLIIHLSWQHVDRSMTKVMMAIQPHLGELMAGIRNRLPELIDAVIASMAHTIASTCRVSRRSSKSASFQLLTRVCA